MQNDSHSEVDKLLQAILSGNRELSLVIVKNYLTEFVAIPDLYENLLRKALYRVGELWEYNKITVATEHLASAVVETLMNELYEELVGVEKSKKKAIITCVEKELHQIGSRMVSDVFEMNGWNSYFLGANTPRKDLLSFVDLIKPDVLAISMSIYFHMPLLENLLEEVNYQFPDLNVLVGGQAFRHGGLAILEKYDNVTYKENLYAVNLYIKKIKE